MNYKITLLIILSLFVFSCDLSSNNKSKINNTKFISKYKNTGFALIYNNDLQNIKPLEERSLNIYHKSIKKKSMVKITNPENNKYLIAEVKSNRVKFSDFYNSILSMRIAKELELDLNEPYVEVIGYLLIFIILFLLGENNQLTHRGRIFGLFLILVFGFRIGIEFLKANQKSFEANMTLNMGQILSIPLLVAGLYLLINSLRRSNIRN